MNVELEPQAPAAPINWWDTLTDRAFLANPYPELNRLREISHVHYDAASDVYFVLGYREFAHVARSPEFGRDTRLWRHGWSTPENRERDPQAYRLLSEFQPQMINSNPPDHRRMRSVYERAFKAEAMQALSLMIHQETQCLLDAMPAEGTVDLMQSFATPLPLRVLRNMFEMPASMDEQMSLWSAALIQIGDVMMTAEQKQAAYAALTEFKSYLRSHLADRRASPGNGLIDAVIAAAEDGTLDEDETLINLIAMLIAGHETTVTLLGNGMLSLLRCPGEMARLRSHPELISPAIEEFLRFEPGGNMILRVAIHDTRIGDVPVPAGSLVLGLMGAVNRDPAVFDAPDLLDIGRHPNPQLTFGGGPHLCIGAPLARMEARIAFLALLDRFPFITLQGEPQWRLDRINARGLGSLPVQLGVAR